MNQQGQPQRPTGILKNGEMIRTGDMVKELQTYLGFQGRDIDGKFGPKTERAVRTFQQNSGLRVDGIVGPNTIEKIRRMAQSGNTPSAPGQRPAARDGGIPQGTTTGGPSQLRQRRTNNGDGGISSIPGDPAISGSGLFDSIEETNMSESINEEITITGDPESLLRMMKLAGATDAKEVDAGDINPNVGSSCGNRNGDLARSIELMADENWDNSPDEDVADFDANPPSNDLNKSKTSHPPAAGGDNPMALEDELRAKLSAALEEKKK
jgi:peptidoglycan hydrolase-like protein with peptidoglycan-binding domain